MIKAMAAYWLVGCLLIGWLLGRSPGLNLPLTQTAAAVVVWPVVAIDLGYRLVSPVPVQAPQAAPVKK
jgi:hypothetical protein